MYEHGVIGLFTAILANSTTTVVFADLCIALGLAAVWMAGDARERGVAVVPYLLLTPTLGSVGPLLYLVREGRAPVRTIGMARAS